MSTEVIVRNVGLQEWYTDLNCDRAAHEVIPQSMKILWVKTDFLHPTTRGGQIRTLEMLRELHKNHEVHYVAFDDPNKPEGLERSLEYCSVAHPVVNRVASKRSIRFAGQLLAG